MNEFHINEEMLFVAVMHARAAVSHPLRSPPFIIGLLFRTQIHFPPKNKSGSSMHAEVAKGVVDPTAGFAAHSEGSGSQGNWPDLAVPNR